MDENYGSAELVTLDHLVRSNDDHYDAISVIDGAVAEGAMVSAIKYLRIYSQ